MKKFLIGALILISSLSFGQFKDFGVIKPNKPTGYVDPAVFPPSDVLAVGDSFKITVSFITPADTIIINRRHTTNTDSAFIAYDTIASTPGSGYIHTWIDTPLAHNSTYCYTFEAWHNGIISAKSNMSCGTTIDTTDIVPPGEPQLYAQAEDHNSVYLHWTGDLEDDRQYYELYNVTLFPNQMVTLVYAGYDTSWRSGDTLTPNTQYIFHLNQYDWVGNYSTSNLAVVTTTGAPYIDTIPPIAPSNLIATATGLSTGYISWDINAVPQSDAARFYLQVDDPESSPVGWEPLDSINSGISSYNVTGLTGGQVYAYRIRSRDSVYNYSAWSNIDTMLTVAPDTVAPAVPSDLTATTVSSSRIDLSWRNNAQPNDAHFHIYRGLTSSGPWSLIIETNINITSYINTGLSASTRYYYYITAADDAQNESQASNIATDSTLSPGGGEVEAPLASVISNNNNSLTIRWTTVADADSYMVYYWTSVYQHSYNYGYKGYAKLVTTTDTQYVHTGLYDGQEVWYVVFAKNGADTSGQSNTVYGYPTRSTGGTTRHVSSTGTGTWAQATNINTPCSFSTWKTNSTTLVPGDSILFKRGDSFVLGENMVAINGLRGTALKPIVLGAYGSGAAPRFRRTAQNYIFVIDKGFYITVQDLHFNPAAGSSQNWVAIGGNYRSPSDIDTIAYLKFKRNTFEGGTPGITFYFWGSWREDSSATKSWLYGDYLQSVVQYLEIGHNTFTNATGSDNDNINLGGNIDYNWIHHNTTSGTTDGDGIDCMGGRNILIEYNKVSNTARHSFKVMAQRGPNYGLIFRGNVSNRTGNGYQGIEIAGGVGVTYYNNTVPSISFAGDPGGQAWWGVGRDSTFKNIKAVNNAFYGYEASVPYLSSATNYSVRFHSYHVQTGVSWGNPKGLGLIAGNTWKHNLWFNAGWGTGGVTAFINRDHIGGTWNWTCCSIPGYSSTGNDAGGFAGYTVASYFAELSGDENTNQLIGTRALLVDSSDIVNGLKPGIGSPLLYAGLNDNVNFPYWVDATGDSIITGFRSIGAYNESAPSYSISFTTPFAFGSIEIGTDSTKTLYIKNTGNQPIQIDSMKVGYSGKFSISEPNAQVIAVGDSIPVAITFNITTQGSWVDSLQIYMTSLVDTRAVLTGTVTLPQPRAPRSFVATQTGTTHQLNIKATLFDNIPVAKDTIIVIAKVGSAPASRTDGIQLYKGVDTTAVNDDTFTNAAFENVIVHAACYVRSTNGVWLSEPARDTALVGTYTPPDEGDLFNITFESGNLSEFNSTVIDGGSSVQDSVKSQGTYAWEILTDADEITGNPTYGQITFASRGTTVVRFDLWIPAGIPSSLTYSNTHFISISSVDPNQGYHEAGFGFGHFGFGGDYNLRWLRYGRQTNGDYEYEDTYWNADYRGQWVTVEVGWIQHASTGGSYIKINGVAIDDELIYNTTSRSVNRITIGHNEGEALDSGLRWRFDNIRVYSYVP